MSHIHYTPCDMFPEHYAFGGKVPVVKADITQLPFATNSFDAIICMHVLEHIPYDHKAMCELYRVLKPGGWAIIMVPLDESRATTYEDFSITTPEGREKAFGQQDHVRWYGNDYPQRLEAAGFHCRQWLADDEMETSVISRYGFENERIVYQCFKITEKD